MNEEKAKEMGFLHCDVEEWQKRCYIIYSVHNKIGCNPSVEVTPKIFSIQNNLFLYHILYIEIYLAAIQQPAAIRIEAIMNIMVTGSPNNKIDNNAPINGARA